VAAQTIITITIKLIAMILLTQIPNSVIWSVVFIIVSYCVVLLCEIWAERDEEKARRKRW
jgi:hypothetical protein